MQRKRRAGGKKRVTAQTRGMDGNRKKSNEEVEKGQLGRDKSEREEGDGETEGRRRRRSHRGKEL